MDMFPLVVIPEVTFNVALSILEKLHVPDG